MEEITINPTIQDIRRKCRMHMNGDVSASMRKYGLEYKMNFGLLISQIRTIASGYQADKSLAEQLWKENTRELKILAGMLCPTNTFTHEDATRWAKEIPNQEIREQLTVNLFQNLPFAEELTHRWAVDHATDLRTTAYWLLTRILITDHARLENEDLPYPHLYRDALSQEVLLRQSALLALKRLARKYPHKREYILQKIKKESASQEDIREGVIDELQFEFDFSDRR